MMNHHVTSGLCLLAIVFLLASCTTQVTVEGSVPTPLVSKIPARVGIHYSDQFKTFEYKEVLPEYGTYKIDLGAQNLSFFRNLMTSMFETVNEVGEPPVIDQQAAFDGYLVPRIVKYGFLTPAISGLKFYSASIQYSVTLMDDNGQKVGEWNIVGYGKAEGGTFGGDDALGEATMLAIRDGGARIALELRNKPEFQSWVRSVTDRRGG